MAEKPPAAVFTAVLLLLVVGCPNSSSETYTKLLSSDAVCNQRVPE